MDQILITILKDTYTLNELKHRLRALRARLETQVFNSPDLEENPEDLNWLNSLGQSFYQQFNSNNTSSLLAKLEAKVQSTNPLIMYLPFETSADQVKQIGNYVRTKINPNILLDIKFNPDLLAGCALAWKGVLKDYSLKARIEAQKLKILSSFKEYLQK